MVELSIVGEKERAFLHELVRHRVPFIIVGLSAAAVQGAPVVTQDIDLWFRSLRHPGIAKALRKVDGVYVPSIGLNPPMFAGENVELFDIVMNMDGLESFDQEFKRAIDVPMGRCKVKVLPLDRIIKSKKAAGRPKDRLSMGPLKDAIAAVAGKSRIAGKR